MVMMDRDRMGIRGKMDIHIFIMYIFPFSFLLQMRMPLKDKYFKQKVSTKSV